MKGIYFKKIKVFNFFNNSYLFSITRLLIGAEELQLKKPIKHSYGGGLKEFIFEEQEFYKSKKFNQIFVI
jgi:hypothetical protein